jgi:hypothetical protein
LIRNLVSRFKEQFSPALPIPPAVPAVVPVVAAGKPSRVLVLGHSHIIAMQGAADLLRDADEAGLADFRFVQLLDNGLSPNVHFVPTGMELVPALKARLDAELADADATIPCVFDSISGNEYHFIGLVNHPRRFDFVLPSAPDLALEQGCEIIPSVLMKATLKASMEYALTILACLRKATDRPIWHIQSPPPVPDNDEIAAHPQQFADAIAEHGVAPPLVRLKLWRLQSEIYRETCEANGIGFLAVPPEAFDADGFMREAGWHGDPTHANYWYGRMVLEQMTQIVAETRSLAGRGA